RIKNLRKQMEKNGLDAYIVSNADDHSSEYVNNYFKERTYMTQFDGSNGTAIFTRDEAFLWTDGRYFLQAEGDLRGLPIKLMKMDTEGYPSLMEYIQTELNGKRIGFDGRFFSYKFTEQVKKYAEVVTDKNLVDEFYEGRGLLPNKEIWALPQNLSGETTKAKLRELRIKIDELGATSHVIATLDDIAFLLNLRGSDVPANPVFYSFLFVGQKETVLFTDSKFNEEAQSVIRTNKIQVKPYNSFIEFLSELNGEKVLVDTSKTNYSFVEVIKNNNEIIDKTNPSILMKAIKNDVQTKNNKDVHIRDGLAVFRFMKTLKDMYSKGEHIDEFQMAEKVLEFRKRDPKFFDVSFDTIASWNENGAIIHYEPTKESSKTVKGTGFFLLDSGGQYMGGTTDITRTFQLGEVPEEWKHHYTMVLRGFIAVSKAKFIKGTTGQSIDMLARAPFWDEGLDYKHGTGHGVGYMLNVHEGPQGIRYKRVVERDDSEVFVPGMVTYIEPGLYLSVKYGIRIENEIECAKDTINEFGEFYKFDTLTCAPIDLDPVLVKELTKEERKWLNNYHKWVFKKLSRICDESELEYLKYVTRKI
ncbi:MAG: aminopeptidase P family protein, partial [Gammaproteobacteria bacterium]|nr:aminopeptidase P family protein [Gammaproteobacteria bacterium]